MPPRCRRTSSSIQLGSTTQSASVNARIPAPASATPALRVSGIEPLVAPEEPQRGKLGCDELTGPVRRAVDHHDLERHVGRQGRESTQAAADRLAGVVAGDDDGDLGSIRLGDHQRHAAQRKTSHLG
jgi:hypothetical protein